MTARTIAFLAFTAAVLLLVFIMGHHRGRRSCRNEYPDGWDAGQEAERQRWEDATGASWDALNDWNAARSRKPGKVDTAEWEAWLENGDPPSTEVLLSAANERLGKPRVPSVTEVDELVARYPGPPVSPDVIDAFAARHPGPPVVADITSWRPPGMSDTPTIEGVVVTARPPGAADWDRASALPAYAAAALGGHRTVDELVDSIVMRAVRS